MVYLITGKQGAGKTHYADALAEELRQDGHSVKTIDGDRWREEHKNEDYSDDGRYRNLMSAASQAQAWEREGHVVILSFIAPKKQFRNNMRCYWQRSHIIYIPGGTLWEGTEYEVPDIEEFSMVIKGHTVIIDDGGCFTIYKK